MTDDNDGTWISIGEAANLILAQVVDRMERIRDGRISEDEFHDIVACESCDGKHPNQRDNQEGRNGID